VLLVNTTRICTDDSKKLVVSNLEDVGAWPSGNAMEGAAEDPAKECLGQCMCLRPHNTTTTLITTNSLDSVATSSSTQLHLPRNFILSSISFYCLLHPFVLGHSAFYFILWVTSFVLLFQRPFDINPYAVRLISFFLLLQSADVRSPSYSSTSR
jgi:hypothetical protein